MRNTKSSCLGAKTAGSLKWAEPKEPVLQKESELPSLVPKHSVNEGKRDRESFQNSPPTTTSHFPSLHVFSFGRNEREMHLIFLR